MHKTRIAYMINITAKICPKAYKASSKLVDTWLKKKTTLDRIPRFIDMIQDVVNATRTSFCHFVDVSSKQKQHQIIVN